MSLAAWITSIVVAVILYGGFLLCVVIAAKRAREEQPHEGSRPHEDG
jgi:hypothetical protein